MPAVLSSTTSLLGTAYPDGKWPRLNLSVSFIGRLPIGLDPRIPLNISISVPHEIGNYAYPLLHFQPPTEGDDDCVVSLTSEEETQIREALKNNPPSFLPISPNFRASESQSWVTLCTNIRNWMIETINDHSSVVWAWARDAYWIAYVAAYPRFPHAEWTPWDPDVSLDGQFIHKWLEQRRAHPSGWGGLRQDEKWEEMYVRFREHVSFVL